MKVAPAVPGPERAESRNSNPAWCEADWSTDPIGLELRPRVARVVTKDEADCSPQVRQVVRNYEILVSETSARFVKTTSHEDLSRVNDSHVERE